MPAAAVNVGGKRYPELFKARVGGFKSDVKAHGSTVEGHWKLENLSAEEEMEFHVAVNAQSKEHVRRRLSGL